MQTPGNATIFYLVLKSIDLLLDKFESREEDRVHNTRPAHRNTKPAVHPLVEELNLRRLLNLFSFTMRKTVPLIDGFGRVDRIDQGPTSHST